MALKRYQPPVFADALPGKPVRFVDRDRHIRANAALGRAADLMQSARYQACATHTFAGAEAAATALAQAISEAQVAVGLYRQIAEGR